MPIAGLTSQFKRGLCQNVSTSLWLSGDELLRILEGLPTFRQTVQLPSSG
jgi:hypothetical protein